MTGAWDKLLISIKDTVELVYAGGWGGCLEWEQGHMEQAWGLKQRVLLPPPHFHSSPPTPSAAITWALFCHSGEKHLPATRHSTDLILSGTEIPHMGIRQDSCEGNPWRSQTGVLVKSPRREEDSCGLQAASWQKFPLLSST